MTIFPKSIFSDVFFLAAFLHCTTSHFHLDVYRYSRKNQLKLKFSHSMIDSCTKMMSINLRKPWP